MGCGNQSWLVHSCQMPMTEACAPVRPTRLRPLIAPPAHRGRCAGHGDTRPCPLWTQHKWKTVPGAEAPIACQACDSLPRAGRWHRRRSPHMHRARPACSRQINSVLSLTPAWGCWWHLTTVGASSGYGAAVPAQSANSRHITVALEMNLCAVFGSLGHLQPNRGQRAVKVFSGPSTFPAVHRHLKSFSNGIPPQQPTRKGF